MAGTEPGLPAEETTRVGPVQVSKDPVHVRRRRLALSLEELLKALLRPALAGTLPLTLGA